MITSIRLKNFRRFKDETFNLGPGINFIKGINNAGKTTVFYAIEYALFGRVAGFRSPSELLFPGEKTVGVEIIFQGKGNNTYRLQRIHTKPPKARTKVVGHYTLKKFVDESETYVLSSDFQDHEGALSLKLYEIIGLSKKLFEVAVNLKQGEIASILEGTPQLDVVLGVTASVIASEEMRAMALEKEKEAQNLSMFEESARRLEDEKKTLLIRKTEYEKELNRIAQKVESLKDTNTRKKEAETICFQVRDAVSAFDDILSEIINISNEKKSVDTELHSLKKEFGEPDALGVQTTALKKSEAGLATEKAGLVKEIETLTEKRSGLDSEKGDLGGRIERRQSLPVGINATCETCGQQIDQEQNQLEINQWEKKLETITAALASVVQDSEMKSGRIDDINTELKSIAVKREEIARNIELMNGLLNRLGILTKTTDEQINELSVVKNAALKATETGSRELTIFYEKYDIDHRMLFDTYRDIDKDTDGDLVIRYTNLKEQLAGDVSTVTDALKTLFIKSEVKLQGLTETQGRIETDQQLLVERMMEVDREYATSQSNIDKLKESKALSKKLRKLSAGFKDLQVQLRESASSELADNTLKLHDTLSTREHEYKSLSIDPARYTVLVKPFDINREVPAHLYQGGGHKLLLGLAFKLAVARLAGPCPFILLDEPTYGLDEDHRSSLLTRISDTGVANQILLITHHKIGEIEGHHINIVRGKKTSTQETVNE